MLKERQKNSRENYKTNFKDNKEHIGTKKSRIEKDNSLKKNTRKTERITLEAGRT